MTEEQARDFLYLNDEYLFLDKKNEELLLEALMGTSNTAILTKDIPFVEPKKVYNISLFLGMLGIDRFYLKDTWKGILKYFTLGGLGIWWLIDIKQANKNCRIRNNKILLECISNNLYIDLQKEKDEKKKRLTRALSDLIRELIIK